jgi:hypothetical protein
VDHPAKAEPFAEDGAHAFAGVAHVNDDGQIEQRRERELAAEGRFLDGRW